ncbi:MAG TPA: hypothetical protein VE592_02405, partial [Geminicoccaceae bacterium]|nr:hypothetical protein [Geminicoccaceae bacterium]
MVRNRTVFLSGLKTRLDREIAERERSDAAAPPPRWSAAPPLTEDDDWGLETGAPPAQPRADDAPDHGLGASLDRDDQAPSMLQETGATTPWSENG